MSVAKSKVSSALTASKAACGFLHQGCIKMPLSIMAADYEYASNAMPYANGFV
jgi:hypothetical protein